MQEEKREPGKSEKNPAFKIGTKCKDKHGSHSFYIKTSIDKCVSN